MKLFQRAAGMDATFARANAGLSFVHFQSAFVHYTNDIAGAIRHARSHAERALELGPLDPLVNFTLCARLGRGLVGETIGRRAHVDLAMRLGPLDPRPRPANLPARPSDL
jgi:hypothetical protein